MFLEQRTTTCIWANSVNLSSTSIPSIGWEGLLPIQLKRVFVFIDLPQKEVLNSLGDTGTLKKSSFETWHQKYDSGYEFPAIASHVSDVQFCMNPINWNLEEYQHFIFALDLDIPDCHVVP